MIFRNEYKKDNEKAPDFKGKLNIDGVIKEIALWNNAPKDGKKGYFGAMISDEYVKEETVKQEDKELPDDDLPF